MSVNTNFQISPVDMEKRQKLDLRAGMTVRVWQKIQEKGKTRLQAYEGLVIARKHGIESGATFTVRKVASGVGMEKIFPIYSPNIDKIEILRSAKVRQSKLYYIREKAAKEIRRRMKNLGFDLSGLTSDDADARKAAEAAVATAEANAEAGVEEEVAPEIEIETKTEETPTEAQTEETPVEETKE